LKLSASDASRHAAGFILVEFLIVFGILAIMAAIVITAITPFLNMDKTVTKDMERNQVETAIVAYLAGGNTIDRPFLIYSGHHDVLSPYFTKNIRYIWWVGADGKLTEITLPVN
jgi:hypothetical protein